jgi:hypothetical protein
MLYDDLGLELKPGDFIVKASTNLNWARILKITPPHKVRVAVFGPQLYRTTLWAYNSGAYPKPPVPPGEMYLRQALRVAPEGVPKQAMDVLDKEKPIL